MAGSKKKVKAYTHRVSINANADKNVVKVQTSPSIKRASLGDRQTLVNVLLAGTDLGLKELLGGLPVLRAASEAEMEAKVYVFKDQVKDNELYKSRKGMYDTFAGIFQETLKSIFPDVEYIDLSQKHQQDIIFEMTSEEAEEHKLEIAEVVKKVREEKDNEPS